MSLLKKLALGFFCLLCLTGGVQAAMLDNLVAYWAFDGNVNDYTTLYNGTWNGGTETYAAGKFGSAVDLTFASNQYVAINGNGYAFQPGFDLAGADQGDGTHNMTLSLWFTTRAFNTAWECLAGKGEGASWRIGEYSSTAQMSWGGSESPFDPPTGTFTDGAWRHLVYMWQDNIGTSDQRIVYIDGVKVKDLVINLAGYTNYASQLPMIGNNAGAPTRYWDGKIDDAAYWNRTLSEAEVLDLWNSGNGKSVGSFATPTYLPGDADRNGTVDGADLNTVLSNYNQTFTVDPWSMGDFDGNGTVDGADLNTVLSNYNQHLAAADAPGTPEPSTLLLAAAGLAGLLCYAWRKRK